MSLQHRLGRLDRLAALIGEAMCSCAKDGSDVYVLMPGDEMPEIRLCDVHGDANVLVVRIKSVAPGEVRVRGQPEK